ncbi:MAG TPA: substrate-binding domain-containing protein [Mycobacteriales bacterium]|nr:substrate-binding domain-containing protein [Mycobacteriales bacterium]
MRRLTRTTAFAAGVATVTALSLGLPGVAHADSAAARNGDVVGVGSDTLQNGADFLFDGAPGVVGGYNTLGNNHRVYSFFATGDANGRATYDGTCGTASAATGLGTFCANTNNQAPNLLPATVVLRDGTVPVTRPNGSGAGVAALINDTPGDAADFKGYQGLPNGSIQFARMSRLPNSTEEGECPTSGACGGLHVYQFATDKLQIAHDAATYNGPSGLSADELYHIFVTCDYTKWNQIPGNSAGSSDTIHPLIPQSGSGTRNFFLADLAAAEGITTTLTPGACTRTVEEHDPTGIYADPTPADAIEPFSTGKLALINSGYFKNAGYSGNGAANGAYTPGFLTTLKGTAPDTKASYNSTRGLYFVIRNTDLASKTPLQAGGTQNWAQTLFVGSNSVIARAANAPLIEAAGFTPAYKDCGVNPTSC